MKQKDVRYINFDKLNGLIPSIIQDSSTKEVLMLGFMNEEALRRTIKEKQVVFWSRTKKRLWKKGEESGSFLNVVSIEKDCDNDTVLILADPLGKTCHKGQITCFGDPKPTSMFFHVLSNAIKAKKKSSEKDSYTRKLFKGSADRVYQKVGEEAIELVIAAKNSSKQRILEESADLMYHLLVLWEKRNVCIEEIVETLMSRNKRK